MLRWQRKTTFRLLTTTCLTALAVAVSAGCSGGLETEEANEICNEIQKREPSQFDDAGTVKTSCVICYEDCGNDCSKGDLAANGTATFQCDDAVCTPAGCN